MTEFASVDDPRHEQANGRDNGKARILPGTDYADMSTVSAKRWLVHHLLAVGELSAFYGEPGIGQIGPGAGYRAASGRRAAVVRPPGEAIRRAVCRVGTGRRGRAPGAGVRHRA